MGTGRLMKKETFESRQPVVAAYCRGLRRKFGGDERQVRRAIAETIGVTTGQASRYMAQALNSKDHVSGGIPYADNFALMVMAAEDVCAEMNLTPTGRPRKCVGEQDTAPLDDTSTAAACGRPPVTRRVVPPVADPILGDAPDPEVWSAPKDLLIVKSIMEKLEPEDLRTVIEHAVNLLTK